DSAAGCRSRLWLRTGTDSVQYFAAGTGRGCDLYFRAEWLRQKHLAALHSRRRQDVERRGTPWGARPDGSAIAPRAAGRCHAHAAGRRRVPGAVRERKPAHGSVLSEKPDAEETGRGTATGQFP